VLLFVSYEHNEWLYASNTNPVKTHITHYVITLDTVRHSTLLNKITRLDVPDHVYNWLVDFFAGHMHQTKYGDQMSSLRPISASIIQGSAIGPASYVVNASVLHAVTDGNEFCKYADDTYVIIPAVNDGSRSAELCNITHWAHKNNLKLNLAKLRR